MTAHSGNTLRSQFEPVTTEDVLEVLQEDPDFSIEDLYAVGVDYAKRDVPPESWVLGRIIVELTRRVSILEDELKAVKGDPDRLPRRAYKGTRKPPSAATPAVSGPPCPKCNSPSTLRSAKATGEKFWGCTSFPKCRGTSPFEEEK